MKEKKIIVEYIKSEENPADGFTKSLGIRKFKQFIEFLKFNIKQVEMGNVCWEIINTAYTKLTDTQKWVWTYIRSSKDNKDTGHLKHRIAESEKCMTE